jgi:hypothetical protein
MNVTWSRATRGDRGLAGEPLPRRRVTLLVAVAAAVLCAGLLTGAGLARAAGTQAATSARAVLAGG